MFRRTPLLMLALGLVVGTALGGWAGYTGGWREAEAWGVLHTGPVLIGNGLEPFAPPKPTMVRVGMTKPEVQALLKSEGFTPPSEAETAEAGENLWRWTRPWRSGYHYANVRFANGTARDVTNIWGD